MIKRRETVSHDIIGLWVTICPVANGISLIHSRLLVGQYMSVCNVPSIGKNGDTCSVGNFRLVRYQRV